MWSIGADLGGTKIEIAAVQNGKILHKILLPTEAQQGHNAIIGKIEGAVRQLIEIMGSSPKGVGIGIAGQIKHNMVLFAPNLPGWINIPLKDILYAKLSLPISVLNDVRAATIGEWNHGAGKGCNDFVCVFLGTGIGGGIVSNGHLLEGNSNSAGEIGHMVVDLYGPPCTCGNHGCFESLAGGWAIAKMGKVPSAKDVIMAAKAEDVVAMEIIENVFEAIFAASISLINAFNPKRLIFGGGLSLGLEVVPEMVDAAVRGRALKAATDSLEVVAAKLGNEAGVIGAATYAMRDDD